MKLTKEQIESIRNRIEDKQDIYFQNDEIVESLEMLGVIPFLDVIQSENKDLHNLLEENSINPSTETRKAILDSLNEYEKKIFPIEKMFEDIIHSATKNKMNLEVEEKNPVINKTKLVSFDLMNGLEIKVNKKTISLKIEGSLDSLKFEIHQIFSPEKESKPYQGILFNNLSELDSSKLAQMKIVEDIFKTKMLEMKNSKEIENFIDYEGEFVIKESIYENHKLYPSKQRIYPQNKKIKNKKILSK